jgi:signal transduction histidine kinase
MNKLPKINSTPRRVNQSGNLNSSALAQSVGEDPAGFVALMANSLEAMPQGVVLIDRAGKVIAFNSRAQLLIGLSAEEVVGKYYLWDFWQGDRFADQVKQAVVADQSLPEGSQPKAKYSVNFAPCYDAAQRFVGATVQVWSSNEVSPLTLSQDAAKPQAVGRIISAIAHEINNPLQTIRTSLELIQDPKKSANRRLSYLQSADNEINRIVQIISQMRKFYRPTPGEKQLTEVNTTVHEALQLLSTSLEDAEIKVKLKLGANLPPVALLSYQLEQVFLYLLLQAMEVLPPDSILHIQTGAMAEGYVAISFSDHAQNGRPSKNGKEPVFDPFHSGKNGGLGLGLSISQEIIKELGGYLQSGEGFSLTIYLPY